MRRPAVLVQVAWPDLVVATADALIVLVGSLAVAARSPTARPLDPLAGGLLILTALPLLVRRTYPVVTLVVITSASLAYSVLGYAGALYTVSIAVALTSAVLAGRRAIAIAVAVATVAAFLAVGILTGRGHVEDLSSAAWFAGWLAAALVVGEVQRGRQALLAEAHRRAAEAERTREEEGRRRATEERLRIARELHDTLAHRLSSISVQAGVGLHLIDRQPDQARVALSAINGLSKEALRELRSTLGLLREAGEADPRGPTAGLAHLDALLADIRATGMRVDIVESGVRAELPTAVDIAAYRIIQESLTNVLRHADGRAATVRVSYAPDAVEITIQDDADVADPGDVLPSQAAGVPNLAAASLGSGSGIMGMRERAASLGGSFEAGPTERGGFAVAARLPLAANR